MTENLLPRKYINYLPIDPRTNQYYAYGKTFVWNFFEIAGVNKQSWNFQSQVEGNYNGEEGPINLIREYNGPNFVYNNSTENFPYNPEEKVLTGKISSFSGSVSINSTITQKDQILSYILRTGDTINVWANGYANLYFSDGSHSTLGSTSSNSQLKIATMAFKKETNLVSKIQLALSIGNLWTQAAKLDSESEFEVYTTDTTAAVRGTVFSVGKTVGKTNITVEQGKVKVAKLAAISSFNDLTTKITSQTPLNEQPIIASWLTSMWTESGVSVSYIDASTWPMWMDVFPSSTPPVKNISPTTIKQEISNNISLKIVSINSTPRELKFEIPERLKSMDTLRITDASNHEFENKSFTLSGSILTLNSSHIFTQKNANSSSRIW
jgi:hypothetical protein